MTSNEIAYLIVGLALLFALIVLAVNEFGWDYIQTWFTPDSSTGEGEAPENALAARSAEDRAILNSIAAWDSRHHRSDPDRVIVPFVKARRR